MYNKKGNLIERRLYEYALHAVCSPLNVVESGITSDQLAIHVAKLFNVDIGEHEDKYMRYLKKQPRSIVLIVDVKKARNLPAEDQNGLSDPYCKVSVVYSPKNSNGLRTSNISMTPSIPSSQIKRKPSLFSCIGSSTSRNKSKPSSRISSRRSSKSQTRQNSTENLSTDKNKALRTVTFRTEIRPKTLNPEWNEHFEFEIENVYEQHLHIVVFDSDRNQIPGMQAVVKEKRGVSRKIRGIRTLFATGEIEDDFLGQLIFDIKKLATFDCEQWFPLTGLNNNRPNNSKSQGEILLGLKVHFKLDDQINWLTNSLYAHSPTISKDDRNRNEHQRLFNSNVLEFRRRHSTLSSDDETPSSIILRSNIFRKYFRPVENQARDYRKTNIFEDDLQSHISQNDGCLAPIADTDLPLFIEEYHQLFRIVMLHELEDTREKHKDSTNNLVIDWAGALNELSYNVLTQFRILYNIPILSESFIQLLVIMELRYSDDYASFISQGIIEAYLKLFMDKVEQRTNVNDLDFTDYEKTLFNEVFRLFIGHYKQRVHNDAPWYLPSKENLPNIHSIFETICTLLQLKICSNETFMRNCFEETIKIRLSSDIDISFNLHPFIFNDEHEIQLNTVRDFLDYVKKLAESMSTLNEYNRIFILFNVSYIKICFFESNGVGDRLSELIKCLLTDMTDYFRIYSKPMVKSTSSIYDPNLIQSSSVLLNLYIYVQKIVTTLKDNLEPRDWITNGFKLKLIEYREWFSPTMKFLLEGFVAHIRQAMERAVEDDNDPIPDEDIILYSQSSMAATSLCIKLCREWESIDFPDPDIRYNALIKLTNTICEQCQHYARRTARKLSENRYFTDLNRTRSFNVSKKLCMLVNDIEYVKRNVLSSLPNLLNFSTVIAKISEAYPGDFDQTKLTLERLISTAAHEMTDVIKLIFDHVATLIHTSLKSKILNYYQDEKRGKIDCMKDVNRYIDHEILQHLYKGLEPVQYSRVACAIRIKVLQCLRELLPLQEAPDFYDRVLQSFDHLADYFEVVCREEPHLPGPPCDEIGIFRRTLQKCALTTEQLQLLYFREICQMHSPHEYPTNNGEILFRTAYEIVNGLVTIYVFILGCRNLLKMDLIGSSDPYVILELLPHSIYHKPQKENRTNIQKRTLNPEFNESFQWHRLPLNVLHERGAVLRLSVWDKDIVNDDFIGECFVPLTNIGPLKNLAELRDVPVSEVRLRRPHKNLQPRSLELIRNRAVHDEQAAVFLKQRTAVMQSGTESDGASGRSDDRNSSGSYASTALRSLINILPFNLGFGFESSTHNRSNADDDEKF